MRDNFWVGSSGIRGNSERRRRRWLHEFLMYQSVPLTHVSDFGVMYGMLARFIPCVCVRLLGVCFYKSA